MIVVHRNGDHVDDAVDSVVHKDDSCHHYIYTSFLLLVKCCALFLEVVVSLDTAVCTVLEGPLGRKRLVNLVKDD